MPSQPQPQDSGRLILVLILLFWLMSNPDNGPVMISGPSFATSRLQRQRLAHGVLNSTKWGDFSPHPTTDESDPQGDAPRFLNLTGFREGDGYAWEDLGRFQDRCREWSGNAFSGRAGEQEWDRPGPTQIPWKNATGRVHGTWVRRPGTKARQAASYNLSAIAPDLTWQGGHGSWGRNVTGSHGKISLSIEEYDGTAEYVEESDDEEVRSAAVVRETSAFVALQDEASGTLSWSMRLHGVHWPRQGAILLSTTSEKFAGIFGLPHLAPGSDFFRSGQQLLGITLDEVLKRKEKSRFVDPSNPWSSVVEGTDDIWALAPHCEYVMYVQLHPLEPTQTTLNNYRNHAREGLDGLLDEMEGELRHPTGAPIKTTPKLKMSMVAWSPDCGYFLESKGPPLYPSIDGQHLVGLKEEVFIYQLKTWLMGLAAIYMGQIWLLKAQMKETCTPSTIGRVSFYTAGVMLLADGIVFTAAATLSLASVSTFLNCLLVTFATFLSMVIGGAFLADVFKIQEPEWLNRDRSRGRNRSSTNSASAPAAPAPTSDTLPPPVTTVPARPPSPPIIIPSDQDIDAEIAEATAAASAVPVLTVTGATTANTARQPQVMTFNAITARFVLLGVFIIFVSVAASSWPAPVRALYVNSLAFVYLSLWVPQIWRNVQRNSRRAFAWRFMIGQSVLRLTPFAYFYLREDNIIFAEPDWATFALLAGWLWVQLWILAFQDVLGPRFGIPASWAPEAWDYHPILREDNIEAGGLPIGLVGGFESAPASPETGRGRSWSAGGREAGEGSRGREKDKDRERKGTHIRSMDCAICREILEVPVVRAGAADPTGGGVAGVLARRAYMVTPCRHIFHTKCLEGWLRFRLQCPICRDELPPL